MLFKAKTFGVVSISLLKELQSLVTAKTIAKNPVALSLTSWKTGHTFLNQNFTKILSVSQESNPHMKIC